MSGSFLNKLGLAVLTMFVTLVIVFGALRILPSNPAALLLGDSATPEQIRQVTELWGLDKPIAEQFVVYLKNLLTGNAGFSFQYTAFAEKQGIPVAGIVLGRVPYTIILSLVALAIAILVAVPLGILTASKADGVVDHTVMAGSLVLTSLPNFWVGLLLIELFSLNLGWLPSGGAGTIAHAILPAVMQALPFIVVLTRLTRTEVARAMRSDYVATARAKGLHERSILWRHALPNVAIPLVTIIGVRLGGFLNGSLVIETLFRWPGIGSLMINSIGSRDYPVIQFLVPLAAVVMIALNFLTDMIYGLVDPRVRERAK